VRTNARVRLGVHAPFGVTFCVTFFFIRDVSLAFQVNVRVTTLDAELEFAIQPSTTGKQLFDQVRFFFELVCTLCGCGPSGASGCCQAVKCFAKFSLL